MDQRNSEEGQHKFDTTKRGVTINFTASRGRVTFFNKKYRGRDGRFYIHAHRDSSPLLKNERSLNLVNFCFEFLQELLML